MTQKNVTQKKLDTGKYVTIRWRDETFSLHTVKGIMRYGNDGKIHLHPIGQRGYYIINPRWVIK